MIGYYTDNNVSHTVMKAFSRSGIQVKHIKNFDSSKPGIFYGILRGAGPAMRLLKDKGIDFWYVDNGYFDAQYNDLNKTKQMSGKYRIVKNGLLDEYKAEPVRVEKKHKAKFLILPPSQYSAFMHDTTPEDWEIEQRKIIYNLGHEAVTRQKDSQISLEKQMKDFDAILAFNSIGVISAINHNKAVYTTNGIIKNSENIGELFSYYDINDIKKFYDKKQFALDEISELGVKCLTQ